MCACVGPPSWRHFLGGGRTQGWEHGCMWVALWGQACRQGKEVHVRGGAFEGPVRGGGFEGPVCRGGSMYCYWAHVLLLLLLGPCATATGCMCMCYCAGVLSPSCPAFFQQPWPRRLQRQTRHQLRQAGRHCVCGGPNMAPTAAGRRTGD